MKGESIMAKQRMLHHERYIIQRNQKDCISFQIYIKHKNADGLFEIFNQTINSKDYESPSMALDAACRIRDDMLEKFRQGFCVNKTLTVEECFKKEKDLFPVSTKTLDRHQSTFDHAIKPYGLHKENISSLTAAKLQASLIKYAKTNSQGNVNEIGRAHV